MRFPGKRKSRHYFPVAEEGRLPFDYDYLRKGNNFIVGVDQLLVDIEANVEDDLLAHFKIPKGESVVFEDSLVEEIYQVLKGQSNVIGEYAGGTVGNTLHNFSVLSESKSVVLGTIKQDIQVGDYAFKYICTTSSKVDFSYLQPRDGAMGRAICFVTPDGERSFVIGKGIMNDLHEDFVPEKMIAGASAILISTYLLRDSDSPIYKSTMKAAKLAKKYDVPLILSLGTTNIVEEQRSFLINFIDEYVTVLAGNDAELAALTNQDDPLLSCEAILDNTDLVLLTVGEKGLYLAGWVEFSQARKTGDLIHSKSISEYNKFEYSRPMKKDLCDSPIKIYTHINPFLGGPLKITNTNGAGDAALAALMHDIAANDYHREIVPSSPKHKALHLTYSSLHQVAKYSNRVSYEVLCQNSPRLYAGLPVKEECLEESYWEK